VAAVLPYLFGRLPSNSDATTETESAPRATRLLVEVALVAAVFLGSYIVLFDVAIDIRMVADHRFHLEIARRFAATGTGLPAHPLFHALSAAGSRLSGIPVDSSAMLLLSLSIAFSALLIHRLILGAAAPAASTRDLWAAAGLTLLTLLAQPIFIPSFNELLVGQSSPNIWHNPTNMVLKPLALVSAICLERVVFGQPTRRDYAAILAAVLIGILAKPAFAMVLIPVTGALAAYLFLPARYRFGSGREPMRATSRLFLAGLTVVSIAAIAAQARLILDERGMQISVLTVWREYSPSVPLSILLVTAFPICVTVIEVARGRPLRGLGLAWAFTIAGIAIFAIFADSGDALLHGNFGWSYQIALAVLYPFVMRSYFALWREGGHSEGLLIASAALAAHISSGLYYLNQLMALHYYN
jgi:hypothetical protein